MDLPVIIKHWLSKSYLAVAATVCVCILLFAPSSGSEEDSRWINDKIAHGIVFTGLSFLWMQYFQKYSRVLMLLILFAFFTEMVQYLLPASFHRSFDLKDILADVTGILAGLVVSRLFNRLFF